MAKHLGVKIQFVDYLDDQTHGILLVREKRVLVNARKPRFEHVFTILHELGHLVIHASKQRRTYHPRIFDHPWQSVWMDDFSARIRRYYRFIFNRNAAREWEADLWAFCAFIAIAKHFDCHDQLLTFVERHPEKLNTFLLAALGSLYAGAKAKLIKIWNARLSLLPVVS